MVIICPTCNGVGIIKNPKAESSISDLDLIGKHTTESGFTTEAKYIDCMTCGTTGWVVTSDEAAVAFYAMRWGFTNPAR